jgi:alpha-ketoglutarate-dependent taurine dioxygenase
MYYKRPTIVTGEEASGPAWDSHVNYAPQFQGPMDDLTPAEARKFYGAFQKLADFIETDSLRFQLTLQPGDLVLFANRRVLHGRTAFDPTSGDRHLKGTYLTLDSLKDKLRVLSGQYGFDPSV